MLSRDPQAAKPYAQVSETHPTAGAGLLNRAREATGADANRQPAGNCCSPMTATSPDDGTLDPDPESDCVMARASRQTCSSLSRLTTYRLQTY